MTLYYILLGVWLLAVIAVWNNIKLKKMTIESNKFQSNFSNKLYELSYAIPFVWFVEDDDNLTERGKDIQGKLSLAGYNDKYTVRSFMTMKVVAFLICIGLGVVAMIVMMNSAFFSKVLLNIETEAKPVDIKNIAFNFSIWMAISLIPNMMLTMRVKKAVTANSKDIPILQMFIILMLRANKTVTDILFALSKLDTAHKENFEQGYRIYIRNKNEGIDYLKECFKDTRFEETFSLFEDIGEYAKEDCIRLLESNMNNIVEETTMVKRKNDMTSMIYSQASMAFPFAVVILLGAVPIIVYGMSLFMNSGMPIPLG